LFPEPSEMLRDLAMRGEHPAVIAFGEDDVVTWAARLSLRRRGAWLVAFVKTNSKIAPRRALGAKFAGLDRRGASIRTDFCAS
jgi:hypothetical protein